MAETSTQPGSGLPTSRPRIPNSRLLDVTLMSDGKIVEMKFGPDKPSRGQLDDIRRSQTLSGWTRTNANTTVGGENKPSSNYLWCTRLRRIPQWQ